MILSYAFCSVPVMPIRLEPAHTSEMVTQALFGEKLELIEINEQEWAKIRCSWDGYIGWCKLGQVTTINEKEFNKPVKHTSFLHQNKLAFEESEQHMPMGADLFGVKKLKDAPAKFKGKKLATEDMMATPEKLVEMALHYQNAPYLWGGRSYAGIDCSGLMQVVFKMCGMNIPRNASEQSEEGDTIDFLQHSRTGDLAFFDNADGKITHVGLLIDHDHIIHATDTSGKVVIDRIDPGGIISRILKRRTHSLRVVKRYI